MLKTPLESDQWFQGYEQLKDFENNRNSFLFLTINVADFRLNPLDCNSLEWLPRQCLKHGLVCKWLDVGVPEFDSGGIPFLRC